MNWLDFTLIGVFAIGTLFGMVTGPLWQIYRISSVAVSVAAALLLHKLISSILSGMFNPELSGILGYSVTFGVALVITYAIGNLFRKFLTKRKFGVGGRMIGGGISFVKTVLTCSVIIAGVSFLGNDQTGKTIDKSLIAKNIGKGTKAVIFKFPQKATDISKGEKEKSEGKHN